VQQQEHKPVLLKEVVQHLRCTPGKCFVDGTVGGGGHARAILEKTAPDGLLIGVDWDENALEQARINLEPFGERLILIRDNFAEMGSVLTKLQLPAVDGILLDLGLSSFQVDSAERGFSFGRPGPLDMRMDTRTTTTAAQLVNTMPEAELAELLFRFGEERWSKKIARAISRTRSEAPIDTTTRLAEVVTGAIPPSKRSHLRHPATRTFQALRLVVNHELDNLSNFLRSALTWLRPGGRLAIISFHSLEDRLVKQRFAYWAKSCRCPANLPVCRCEGVPLARLPFKKPISPNPEELRVNPRARSGRLRVVEKLEVA
jgi:16S rRNA (cytosine1402-N4)-methyltransferase